MTSLISLILAGIIAQADAKPAPDRAAVVIVVGAAGDPEYAPQFRAWADGWTAACKRSGAKAIVIGLDESTAQPLAPIDRDALKATLAECANESNEPLWLVLIGHGTFDGKLAKFNLRGPDVSDDELAGWLQGCKRPLVVIDCSSASSPFLNRLSGADRVIVTATRSGNELNFARFGEHVAKAIADPRADLDKDGQVSVLEAFLSASSRVAEFYQSKSRLATEHPLIDDNGDKLGTPADWFRGVRATKRAKEGASPDGLRANQIHLIRSGRERGLSPEARAQRDRLELELAALRDRKSQIPDDEYYDRVESLMLPLAHIYESLPDSCQGSDAP